MLKIEFLDRHTGLEPAAQYATDAEVEFAQRLRHRLEERYLGRSDSPSGLLAGCSRGRAKFTDSYGLPFVALTLPSVARHPVLTLASEYLQVRVTIPLMTKRRREWIWAWFYWALSVSCSCFAFMHVGSKMASERESATRRRQSTIQPFSGDTITYAGHSSKWPWRPSSETAPRGGFRFRASRYNREGDPGHMLAPGDCRAAARGRSEGQTIQMHLPALTLRDNALLYVVKLLTGSMIVWYGLRAVGIPEPYWAMISLIVVSEPDVTVAKKNVLARLINTANGAVVACLALFAFGASFFSMMVAMTVAVLIAMMWQNYPANWRLAPNTAVILMAARAQRNGLPEEVALAMFRVLEVITGSSVALLQTVVYAYLVGRWRAA